ncbi:AzlC family ABC transporter permease [Streptomyces sp. NPDC004749]
MRRRDGRRTARAYSTFAMTDEAYALTTSGAARTASGRRILWLQGFVHLYWVTGATIGALLGAVIPDRVTGLDFTLTALFTVLALDAVRADRDLPTPVIALLSALVARLVLPGRLLLVAFALFTAGLLARYLLTARARTRAEPGTGPGPGPGTGTGTGSGIGNGSEGEPRTRDKSGDEKDVPHA